MSIKKAVLVREAEGADAADIARLMKQLGYEIGADLIAQKIDALSGSGDDTIFLAVEGERIVGCLSAHAHDLLHAPGRLGQITALVVDTDARGFGIGRTLIDRAADYFLDRGCARIEVTSANHRLEAHDFYQSVGFTGDGRRFVKKL